MFQDLRDEIIKLHAIAHRKHEEYVTVKNLYLRGLETEVYLGFAFNQRRSAISELHGKHSDLMMLIRSADAEKASETEKSYDDDLSIPDSSDMQDTVM